MRFVLALLLMLSPLLAHGWYGLGHRTVARLAESRLTLAARAGIAQLLGPASLNEVATWADDIRNGPPYKQTTFYHTEKIPAGIDYLRYLRAIPPAQQRLGGIVEALLVADAKLRDAKTPRPERIDALKFFVHFVGDIHQPLHTGPPEDEYGTKRQLTWFGQSTTLHELWDSGLIKTGHPELFPSNAPKDYDASPAYTNLLNQRYAFARFDLAFDVEGWLNEGLRIRSACYDPRVLSDQTGYLNANLPVVDQRIFMAGLRLATELNQIFAMQPVSPQAINLWTEITTIVGPPDQLISLRP